MRAVATRKRYVGREVFDRYKGLMATVIKEDGMSVVIEYDNADGTKTRKRLTPYRFRSTYIMLDEDPNIDYDERRKCRVDRYKYPMGMVGIGEKLADVFRMILVTIANQDLLFYTNKNPTSAVIKYNGKNAFELTILKRRIHIHCRQEALSPEVFKRNTKVFPKSWGWPLNVRYTFWEDTFNARALMRAIAIDGLYYCQEIDEIGDYE